MAAAGMPPAEVDVTHEVVRGLLHDQHPDLAAMPIRLHAEGWDNMLFRLGDDLMVRLPRRAAAADLIVNEVTWLPRLAADLPLAVPVPIRTGRPSADFPWVWTVVRWFDGRPLDTTPLADPLRSAVTMGSFLAALHRPAPQRAPENPVRGGPLVDRLERFEEHVRRLPADVDVPRVRAAFLASVEAPTWQGPPMWLHGDLHPHNVLESEGDLVAVVDFGDITGGDPATDLMMAWSMFDAAPRAAFRAAAESTVRPIDEAMWRRGRGWAIAHSVATIASGADSARQTAVGLRTLRAALA